MRALLFLLLFVGCTPNREPALSASASSEPASPRWGGLSVVERGRGSSAVVLLHGYRASGDDLVPLAEQLARDVPARFVVPAAPLSVGGGRAWFERDAREPAAQIDAARRALEGVLETLESEGVPAERVVLAGFSQGAMMSLELALNGARSVAGVAVLSGRALPGFERRWERLRDVPIYVSHGHADPILPFEGGASIAEHAEAAGARVTFAPFEGRHEIPPVVRAGLAAFLRDVVAH